MADNVRTATPPNLISQPNVGLFRQEDFEGTIWMKGYDIIKEHAIECPCRGTSGSPKTTCNNCLGIGWFFINPIQTKAIISSINKQTKYQQWSPELAGTVNISVRNSERFSFMDKITFVTRTSIFSEVCKILSNGAQKFVFCSYKVNSIRNIWMFNTDTTKLTLIDPSNYTINPNNKLVVLLNGISYPAGFNNVISIEYEHNISYNIIDIPHDFRSSFIINENGVSVEHNMPVNGVARRSHMELGIPSNYGGDNLLNNDTE